MKFEKGEIRILNYDNKQMRHLMHYFASVLSKKGKVLVIDTVNCINAHSQFFNDTPEFYFDNIFCVRTPMPYDLWARLRSMNGFIKKNNIETILITSLSHLFKEYNKKEIEPLIKNILNELDKIVKENGLICVIGSSDSSDESADIASEILRYNYYESNKSINFEEIIA